MQQAFPVNFPCLNRVVPLADFSYSQIPGILQPYLLAPGKVHAGFSGVAATLWPGISAALNKLVKLRSTGVPIKHVYVAGHSLGAGVSTLISYAAQVSLFFYL